MPKTKCPPGKIRNPKTGRCRKFKVVKKFTSKKKCPPGKKINPKTGRCVKIKSPPKKKVCPPGKQINLKTGRCVKIKSPPKKKVCPPGKKINPKTGRCVKVITSKQQDVLIKAVNSLKKGTLGKHGYKNINSLTVKNRRKALNKAIDEHGASRIFRKVGLLKTLHKTRNKKLASKLLDNMRWMRKKYDNQFKSSWKTSSVFK